MNIATRIAQHFGLTPLHDVDLPDGPSTSVASSRPRLVDSSPRLGSPGEDGPTASAEQAGAVGHPDWDNIRRDLAHLRSVLLDALCWLDEIDPTPTGLAAVADITDLDTKRGRQSRE